eukprot:5422781-Alexandrium_andersonii.AAC.1
MSARRFLRKRLRQARVSSSSEPSRCSGGAGAAGSLTRVAFITQSQISGARCAGATSRSLATTTPPHWNQ